LLFHIVLLGFYQSFIEEAGIGPEDINMFEVQDTDARGRISIDVFLDGMIKSLA